MDFGKHILYKRWFKLVISCVYMCYGVAVDLSMNRLIATVAWLTRKSGIQQHRCLLKRAIPQRASWVPCSVTFIVHCLKVKGVRCGKL